MREHQAARDSEALVRNLERRVSRSEPLVLEVGCGNGVNGFALASRHPTLRYVGLDFSPTMITNAIQAVERRRGQGEGFVERMAFGVADARELAHPVGLDRRQPHFAGSAVADRLASTTLDAVFTDRMLINLSSPDEQLVVMRRIAAVLPAGGLYFMIENSAQTHAALNSVRRALGLPNRPPAEYNVFIDEPRVVKAFEDAMTLAEVEDFSALHDLLLYAVAPALEDGQVQYDTPLMGRSPTRPSRWRTRASAPARSVRTGSGSGKSPSRALSRAPEPGGSRPRASRSARDTGITA